MNKINLEDLSPQTAFPSSIGKEKELSLIVYNTLKIDFEKKDANNFIIELLMSLNEQNINTIKTIFKYESDLLKDVNTKHAELIALNKINLFFRDSSLEGITVFSSLVQGIPEIKSNVHFRDEIIKLAEILEETVKTHIDYYNELNQDDKDFEKINQNIYFLQNLLNMVKNYALKNLKRLASENSSKMNIEDQVKIMNRLIHINSGDLNYGETKRLGHKTAIEENIEDAIVIESGGNKNESDELPLLNVQMFEDLKSFITETFLPIKDSMKNLISDNNNIKEENRLLKEEIKELSKINTTVMQNFNSFIENQTALQKIIKDKYNITLN